jgi:hypothetical protein
MYFLQICLMSRDEQSVLVVTYSELKHCLEPMPLRKALKLCPGTDRSVLFWFSINCVLKEMRFFAEISTSAAAAA